MMRMWLACSAFRPSIGVFGRGRRGQSRIESTVALGVLLVAALGAWLLYKDAIIETTKSMIGFFSKGGSA